jgi:hypothetical protein
VVLLGCPVSWAGQGEKQAGGEREERGTRGWTELGRARRGEGQRAYYEDFVFLFLKILNSTKFVYFIMNYL